MAKSVWSFQPWDAKLVRLLPKNKCVPLKSLIWNEAMVNYACQDMIFKFGFKDIPKGKDFLLKLQLSY